MELKASKSWHGLQSADPLLAWVREGAAVIVGDGVPELAEVRVEKFPVFARNVVFP